MKRFVLALLLAVVALGVPAAHAGWSPSAVGTGASLSRFVGVPTAPAAAATSSSGVRVTWAAPAAPSVTPTQYVVRRTAPTAATVCTVSGAIFLCDDTGLAGNTTYSYTVEARIGTNWRSATTAVVSATTPASPTFVFSIGTVTAGTPFSFFIRATTNGTNTDFGYSGPKTLLFSGPGAAPDGTTPTYPVTVNFLFGFANPTITLVRAETVTLQITEGPRSGSDSLTVVPAAPELVYTSSTPSCASGSVTVGLGGAFTSRVSVFDTYFNPVNGARTLTLSRAPNIGTLSPTALAVPTGANETTGSFTFTMPSVGNPPNVTVTASSPGATAVQCLVRR